MATDSQRKRKTQPPKQRTQSVEHLYYAYQPIVNIHTGITLGFEALLRGWQKEGYSSIQDVFDEAYTNKNLLKLDASLRESAISTLYSREDLCSLKLFYNIDNRLFHEPEFISGRHGNLDTNKTYSSNIAFEISERHEFSSYQENHSILREYRKQNFRIAIDDFGTGYSGLTLLYHSDPDFIKIDRFFIENINDDSRKKFFVANIVNLAHMMGISVIAEGVETVEEFFICREIGCDYTQGYLIQRPQDNIHDLSDKYEIIEDLVRRQSRKQSGDKNLIEREIDQREPVMINTSTEQILEAFRNNQSGKSFPVVNQANEPLGLLRESELKKYVYSPYGISILQHKSSSEGVEALISRAPVMEISNPIEKIIELYSLNENLESVIMTENGRYAGILDSSAILRILSEKKISTARDQNPLTKLPGNTSINRYLAQVLDKKSCGHILAYFDLDNFKPFNDVYGFRQGDRIIRLFADILQEHRCIRKEFIGHIGGDDFFIGYNDRNHTHEEIINEIKDTIQRFGTDVIAFYKEDDRKNGYITSKGRSGKKEKFPILSVSAAVICIKEPPSDLGMEQLSEKIAGYKIKAKNSKKHIAVLNYCEKCEL